MGSFFNFNLCSDFLMGIYGFFYGCNVCFFNGHVFLNGYIFFCGHVFFFGVS